jgi:transposase-like protein
MAGTTAAELRGEVEKVQGAKGARRYGEELKARAVAYLAEREATGETPWTVSRELGMPWQTLLRWRKAPEKRAGRRGASGFWQVAIGAESSRTLREGIVVHGPHGLRVEGLTQAELVAILRALG